MKSCLNGIQATEINWFTLGCKTKFNIIGRISHTYDENILLIQVQKLVRRT